MNGLTAVSPSFVPNLCKCGHDYVAHIAGSTTTAMCTLCVTSGGPHIHQFTGINEPEPSVNFLGCAPRGYVMAGGGPTYLPGQTNTSGAGNVAGATNIVVGNSASAVVGGVMYVQMIVNPQQSEEYEIIRVLDATHVIIMPPGLLFTAPNGTPVSFYGERGSSQGAACPANGQRAG